LSSYSIFRPFGFRCVIRSWMRAATYAECERAISEAIRRDQEEGLANSPEPNPRPIYRSALCHIGETTVTLHELAYRAVVVHSSAHDRRRHKKIERELAKELES
jgi:hypothetical protein